MIPRLTQLPTQNNDSAVAPSMSAHELAAAHHRMRTAPVMGLGPSLGLAPRPPSADVSLAARQALPFTPPAEDHRDSIEQENAALAKLNAELQSMWPMRRHPAPMVHGPGREHESAQKRDATRIRLHNDPESVAKARRSKLDKQVRRASNQADVDALEHQAEGIQRRAAKSLALDARKYFSDELVPTSENKQSRFRSLMDLVREFGDAAAMWESATDHFAAALQAAGKIHQESSPDVARLQEAVAHSKTTASRLAIKRDVAQGVHAAKIYPDDPEHPEAPQLPLPPRLHQLIHDAERFLAAALKRHRSYADEATLQEPLIEGWDIALRDVALKAHCVLDKLPAQNQAAVLAAASLHQVAVDLRAELRDGFAQAPVRRLQAALRPLLEQAAARENDARALVIDPQWAGCAREVAAWHDAFVTYRNCVATHEKQVATFSVETLQEHERTVLDLQVRISDGMEQSLEELLYAMDAAHPRLYNACNELALSILQPEGTATDVSVQLARFIDIAAQCRDIQAQLHDSPALQHLRDAGVAPDLQLAHFATLEAICRAMSRPVHHAIDALEKAQEFKAIAQSMVRRPHDPLCNGRTKPALDERDEDMGELIDALRQRFLEQAVRVQFQAAIDLFETTKEDTAQALDTATDLASRLHCILPINPPSDATAASNLGEASAAQAPSMPAADKAMVMNLQRQTANTAIGERKHALKLPTDVPAGIRAAHKTALLVLRHVELCSSTAAEIIDSYHRAFHELRAAAPASQRNVAKQHAESLRKLSARIGKALSEQISVAPQTENERKAVIDVGSGLRQIDQLSETMRLGLEGVGLLFEARRKAQDIKHRLTADDKPRAGALNLVDAAKALNKVYYAAVDWMEASTNNIAGVPSGAAEGANAKNVALGPLAWRAAFDRTVGVSMMGRDWCVARLATANSSGLSDLKLENFVKIAKDITEMLSKINKSMMSLFRRDPQQLREFLEVTMGLLKVIQDLRSEVETRLQPAPSGPPLREATAPASLPVDVPAGDALSGMQHRQGQGDAVTISRGESSKTKGKSRRTHRRS